MGDFRFKISEKSKYYMTKPICAAVYHLCHRANENPNCHWLDADVNKKINEVASVVDPDGFFWTRFAVLNEVTYNQCAEMGMVCDRSTFNKKRREFYYRLAWSLNML